MNSRIDVLLVLTAVWQWLVDADPQFDKTPVNVTAINGHDAILPCTAINKEKHQIIWMNPRRILISTADRRAIDDPRMSIERPFVRDWNLLIRDVQVQDNGEYTCQINTNPIQIKRVRLNVHVPAQIENSTSSWDTVVREGTTVKLTCIASGIPEPTITWYRKTLQTNHEKEHVGTTGEVLVIHNISRFCGGLYECEASNNIAFPVRRAINVSVTFPPEVRFRTPRRIGQYRGKEAMLECFITAFPHGVNQWMKNGKPATRHNSWKYRTELYNQDQYTVVVYLRIINLDENDYGRYTCEASNTMGRDENTIILYEYHLPTTTTPPTTTWKDVWRASQAHGGNGGNLNDQASPYDQDIRIGAQERGRNSQTKQYRPGSYLSGYVGTQNGYDGNGSSSTLNLQTSLYHVITWLTFHIILTAS